MKDVELLGIKIDSTTIITAARDVSTFGRSVHTATSAVVKFQKQVEQVNGATRTMSATMKSLTRMMQFLGADLQFQHNHEI